MIAVSGQIPYNYESPRMPFKVLTDSEFGFSGILFEQAMWGLRAERDRYVSGSSDPVFHIYKHVSGVKQVIQPNPSGLNLHRCGDPGASTFIDYIIELRNALSGQFSLVAVDTDFSTADVNDDYFEHIYPTSPGALIHKTFNNVILPGPGQILDTTTQRLLGGSGRLFGIDLGEVLYQPYPHLSLFLREDAHNANDAFLLDQFPIISGPIFPAFQSTDGTLVSTNSRDNIYEHNANDISYNHVQSGVVRFDGDPLPTGTTILRGEPWVSFGAFVDNGNRSVGGNRFTEYGRAFIDPVSTTSGIYRVAVRFDKGIFPKSAISSGIISIFPRDSQYNDIGRSPINLSHLQGYHVFDDAIWVSDNGVPGFLPLTNADPSGLAVLSPLNGDTMWVRLADLTDNSGGRNENYSEMKGMERPSANVLVRCESAGTTIVAGDTSLTFTTFNDLLNRLSEVTTTFTVGAGNSLSVRDMFFDGTNYFVLDSNTSGDDIYEFDSAFSFVDSYEGGTLHPLQNTPRNIERAAFINGSYYHFGTSGALHEFTLNPGPGSATNIGNTRPLDVSLFSSIIGTVNEIQDFINVTGGTHVHNGNWFVIRNTSDTAFLVRTEENPPDFDVVEVHRLRLPEPSTDGEYRVLAYMDIN